MGLDPDDWRPAYRQIAGELWLRIQRGDLSPGDQLPSVFVLAEQWGVSRQTAQNALRHLQQHGVAVGRPGTGSFVRSDLDVSAIDLAREAGRGAGAAAGGPRAAEEAAGETTLAERVDELEHAMADLARRVRELEQGTAAQARDERSDAAPE